MAAAGVYLWSGVSGNVIGGRPPVRNVISANGQYGVMIDNDSTGNTVEGNYIGTDATGSHALGNFVGVWIQSGSTNNTVGGTTAGARNVISANGEDGVQIDYAGTTGNVVEGIYIGTDATGTVAIGNARAAGVYLWSGVSGNMVGGTSLAARNVIRPMV